MTILTHTSTNIRVSLWHDGRFIRAKSRVFPFLFKGEHKGLRGSGFQPGVSRGSAHTAGTVRVLVYKIYSCVWIIVLI